MDVVLLTTEACHLCDDARATLAELGRDFPLRVREVRMESPEGRGILRDQGIAMPPAVFVEGVLFSVGRLPRKKLRKLIEGAA